MSAPCTVIELPELSGVTEVSSAELEHLLGAYAAAGRRVDAGLAVLAGEVERRSSREHGHLGLAQSSGDRTSDAFVSRVTGSSGAAARQLVTVGRLLDATPPWFADVATGVAVGSVSVGAATQMQRSICARTAARTSGCPWLATARREPSGERAMRSGKLFSVTRKTSAAWPPKRTGARSHTWTFPSEEVASQRPSREKADATSAYSPRWYPSRSINTCPQPGQYVLWHCGSLTLPV